MDDWDGLSALLQLLCSLAREESSAVEGNYRHIRVVTDVAAERAQAAIVGIAEAFGGRGYVVLTRDQSSAEPIDRAAVESILGLDGLTDEAVRNAIVSAQDSQPHSDGEHQFLGFLGTIAGILGQPWRFVALVYETSNLDADRGDAVRHILDAAASHITQSGSLVSIEVGSVKAQRHFGRSNRVGYLVTHGVKRRVSSDRDIEFHLADVASTRSNDVPMAFMLGAGFSASSGLPLGDEMRDAGLRELTGKASIRDAARDLYEILRSAGEGPDGFQEYDEVDGRNPTFDEFFATLTLERVLAAGQRRDQRFDDTWRWFESRCDAAKPGSAIADLATIVCDRLIPRLVLFTVNFDELLEGVVGTEHLDVLHTPGDLERSRDVVESVLHGSAERVPLIKLHGTISDRDSVVADIERVLGEPRGAFGGAVDLLAEQESFLIYIGHSMRDRDLQAELARPQLATALRERWVAPGPDRTVLDFIGRYRRPWTSKAGRFIMLHADAYLAAVLHSLR